MMNLTYIHFDNFIKVSKNHKSLKIVKISTFWLPEVAALHTTVEWPEKGFIRWYFPF